MTSPAWRVRSTTHRPVFLLSGLLKCGLCAGGYTIVGKHRLGCATRRSKGTCDNATTIARTTVERRALGGLRERMLTAAEFVRSFEAESIHLRKEASSRLVQATARLAEVERRIAGIAESIENGAWNKTLSQRLDELEREQVTLQEEAAAGGGS